METIRYAFTTDKTAIAIPSQLTTLFQSKEEALTALQNEIENMAIHEDDVQNWELVEMNICITQNAITKYR